MYIFSQYLKKSTPKPEPNNLTVYQVSKVSVVDAALISRHHVFDVDEGVRSAVRLKCLQGLLNKISNIFSSLLAVVDTISLVDVLVFEDVQDG